MTQEQTPPPIPIPDQRVQPNVARITELAGGLTDALGGLRGISVTAENAEESLTRLEEIRRALALIVRGEELIPQATTLSQSPHEVVSVAVAASGDSGETEADIVQVAVAARENFDNSAPKPQSVPQSRPPQTGVRHRIESVWENVNPGIKTAVRFGASAIGLGQRVGAISNAALSRSNSHDDRRSSPPDVVQSSGASVDAQAQQGGQEAAVVSRPADPKSDVSPTPNPQPEPQPAGRAQSMSEAEYSAFQGSLSQALERFRADGEPVPSHLLDVGMQALNDGRVTADEMGNFVSTVAVHSPDKLEEVLNNEHMDPQEAAWGLKNQLLWHYSPDLARRLNEIHDRDPDKNIWYDELLGNLEEEMRDIEEKTFMDEDVRLNFIRTYFLLTGETEEHARMLSRKMDVTKQKGTPVPAGEIASVKSQLRKLDSAPQGEYFIYPDELFNKYLWLVQNNVDISYEEQIYLLYTALYQRRGIREALDAQTDLAGSSYLLVRFISENPYRFTSDHLDKILTDYQEIPQWLSAVREELTKMYPQYPPGYSGNNRTPEAIASFQEKITQRIENFPFQIERHREMNATIQKLVQILQSDKAYKALRDEHAADLQPFLDGSYPGFKRDRLQQLMLIAAGQSIDIPEQNSGRRFLIIGDNTKSQEQLNLQVPRGVWDTIHEYLGDERIILYQEIDYSFGGALLDGVYFDGGRVQDFDTNSLNLQSNGITVDNVTAKDLRVSHNPNVTLERVRVQNPINPTDSNFVIGNNTTLAFDLHHAGAGNIYAGGGDRISCGIRDIGKESLVLVMDPGKEPLITNDTRNTFPPHKNRGSHILHIPLSNKNVQSQANVAQMVNLAELTYGDGSENDFQNEAPVSFSHNGNEYVIYHAHDIEVLPSTKEMREGKETNIVNTKVKAPIKAILQKVENEGKAEYVFVGIWDGGDTMKIDDMNIPVGKQKATPLRNGLMKRLFRNG